MPKLHFRLLALLGFIACIAGLGFAYYLESQGYEPCPLCIFQRVAMAAAGLVFLIGALHGPAHRGRWVYAGLAALSALIGALIAARHIWLQSLPPDRAPACGASLDYLLEAFPLSEVVQTVLRGDGTCALIDAQWLGLSLPQWTLIAFLALSVYALVMPLLARKAA